MTIKDLANHYLAHQHEQMTSGELGAIHFRDCQSILRAFVGAMGEGTMVEELAPRLTAPPARRGIAPRSSKKAGHPALDRRRS